MKILVLIGLCCTMAGLVACGGDDPARSEVSSAVLVGKEGRPDVPLPQGPAPSKLVVREIEEGEGAPASKGDQLTVRYFSFDYKTHKIYEDRWNDVVRFQFKLGEGQILESWEEGMPGVRAGGRRQLIVPDAVADGADQVYVIEVISIEKPESAAETEKRVVRRVKGSGAKPRIEIPPGPPPKELVVRELKPGSGEGAKLGQWLAVRYVSRKYGSDSGEDRWHEKPPYSFVLGDDDIRKGWSIGLQGMKLGARRELVLPSRLAYGTGTIVYVIELVEMERPKPER